MTADKTSNTNTAKPMLGINQVLDLDLIRHPKETKSFRWLLLAYGILLILLIGFGVLTTYMENSEDYPPTIEAFSNSIGFILAAVGYIIGYAMILTIPFLFTLYSTYWLVKGNSIRISPSQYPEIYTALTKACKFLDLRPLPEVYIYHGGGVLRLFALKIAVRRGWLMVSAEVIEALYLRGDSRQLMMILGRELGRIKANYYRWWFFKDVISLGIFPIQRAYRRGCHYTADRIGALVAGDFDAAQRGLLTISVGRILSPLTNMDSVREQDSDLCASFWAKIFSWTRTEPYIINRIIELESFEALIRNHPTDTSLKRSIGLIPPEVNQFNITIHGSAMILKDSIHYSMEQNIGEYKEIGTMTQKDIKMGDVYNQGIVNLGDHSSFSDILVQIENSDLCHPNQKEIQNILNDIINNISESDGLNRHSKADCEHYIKSIVAELQKNEEEQDKGIFEHSIERLSSITEKVSSIAQHFLKLGSLLGL